MLMQSVFCGLAAAMALGACSSGNGEPPSTDGGNPGLRLELTPAAATVFVGEHTSLTPVFDGDRASIDGIGRVQSGVGVETPPLSRATTFTLRVDRGNEQVETQTTVQANYRNRIRLLDGAPVAQTNHVAASLPDGRAMVMGGRTSESPLVPDSTLTQIFDPATEQFARGPDLLFSAEAQLFTSVAPLVSGVFLLAGSGLNAPVGRCSTSGQGTRRRCSAMGASSLPEGSPAARSRIPRRSSMRAWLRSTIRPPTRSARPVP